MVLKDAVPRVLCTKMRKMVEGISENDSHPTAYVKASEHRQYPLLSVEEGGDVFSHTLNLLEPFLEKVVGRSAKLTELGVINVHPGASDQKHHADTLPNFDNKDALMISVFVALADVSFDTGPLDVWPGSQKNAFNMDQYLVAHDNELGVKMAVPAGSVVLYTSRYPWGV